MNEQSIVTYVEIISTFTCESCMMLYHVYLSAGEAHDAIPCLPECRWGKPVSGVIDKERDTV